MFYPIGVHTGGKRADDNSKYGTFFGDIDGLREIFENRNVLEKLVKWNPFDAFI